MRQNNTMIRSAQPPGKQKTPLQQPQNTIQEQIEINKKKIEDKLKEVKRQLDKIEAGLDNCDMIIANGNNNQVTEAKRRQDYLYKNKGIYEQYHDKLIKDSINIEALEGKFVFEAAEELNNELDRIDEERQSIYRSLNQDKLQQSMSEKYTSSVVEALSQRSYKVDIPEQQLDEQMLLIQEEITQRILNQINTKTIPTYLDSITIKKKRHSMGQ